MSWILLSCSPVEKTESGAAAVKNGVSQLPAHFNLIGVHHVRFTNTLAKSGFDGARGLRAFSDRPAGIRSGLQQSLSEEDKEAMVSGLKAVAQWKSPNELLSSKTSQHQLRTDKRWPSLIHASNATAGIKVRAVGHITAGYTD